MGDIPNLAKGLCSEPDDVGDASQILRRELPDGLVGIGIDHDGEFDLALELLEASGVLCLGFSKFIGCGVVDSKLVLLKDVLALGSVAEIIVADEDSPRVEGHGVEETSILEEVNRGHGTTGRR